MDFSIIIPVFNDKQHITSCVDHLMGNQLLNIEIIIVDDGSTDDLDDVILELQKKYCSIVYIKQIHMGLSAARNTGLEHANGKYVYFVDSDDIPNNEVLQTAWNLSEKNNLDVLFFSFESFADNDFIREKYKKHLIGEKRRYDYDETVMTGPEMLSLFLNNGEYYPMVWIQVARRSFLSRYKIRFIEKIIYEDNLYTFEVLKHAKRTMCINKVLYHKRIRENSITTRKESILSVYSFLYTYIEIINHLKNGLIEKGPYSALRTVYKDQSYYGKVLDDIRKQLVKRYDRLTLSEKYELELICNTIEREILLAMVSKISVIIPMYNTKDFILECIQSVCRQTVDNLEILIIDDGSIDSGHDIVVEIMQNDSRIKYFFQENSGSASARNMGIRKSSGDYIAFLDSDDMFFEENALEIMMLSLIRYKANLCGSYRVELKNKKINRTSFLHELGYIPYEGKMFKFSDYQYDFFFQSYLYKASFLKENCIFFPLYRRYEDPVFLLKVMDTSQEFCVCPVILHCYRKGHQNYSGNGKYIYYNLLGIRDNLLMSEHKYEKLYDLTINRIENMFLNDIRTNCDEKVQEVLREINDIYLRKYPNSNGLNTILEFL